MEGCWNEYSYVVELNEDERIEFVSEEEAYDYFNDYKNDQNKS